MFKGKAIYNPSGKAGEYSEWACNFYVGCSNGCTYCYLKKGIGASVLGGNKPTLKKCFRDEDRALGIFQKELMLNANEIRKHGLFFTFTSDPCLIETIDLTQRAMFYCAQQDIPVKMLTKTTWWTIPVCWEIYVDPYRGSKIAFGFTLTGHDELEPGAATNAERIDAMKKLHDVGFKTFASIEPIIDFDSSFEMIRDTNGYCDLYKIGLLSGKSYWVNELVQFINGVVNQIEWSGAKIYFKDSLLKGAGINREDLPANCVTRDYNMFD
jgi:DNA repair photolyase